MPLIPESPRYLLLRGQIAEAEKAMISLGYTQLQRQQLLESVQQQQEDAQQLQQQQQQQHQKQQQQEDAQQQQQQQQDADNEDAETEAAFPASLPPGPISTMGCVYTSKPSATPAAAAAAAAKRRRHPPRVCHPVLLAAALGGAHSILVANSLILFAPDLLLIFGVCDNKAPAVAIGFAKVSI